MDDESDKSSNYLSQSKKKSAIVIEIPSYNEVIEGGGATSSQSKSAAPLFAPIQTFSQAFASIKNSEFYTPPPPASSTALASSRRTGDTDRSPSGSARSLPATVSGQSNTVLKSNAILVGHRQKGNPLLKHIRNVRWNYADVIPDYVPGANSCALYLSLRYHLLHPDYLYFRIRELQKNFRLRVVLCHVDVEDVVKPLLEVTRTAIFHDCTLLCGWSLEECGRYLETIKVYENKPADIIQGHMETDYQSRLNHALTTVRHVNKTDVVTLGSTFGCLAHIMDASMEDLARCPGIGERKVRRLYDTFHEPFKRVVPLRPAGSDAPIVNKTGPDLTNTKPPTSEEENNLNAANKKKKVEPKTSVKSALTAAFAKFQEKHCKKNDGSGEGTSKESVNLQESDSLSKNLATGSAG